MFVDGKVKKLEWVAKTKNLWQSKTPFGNYTIYRSEDGILWVGFDDGVLPDLPSNISTKEEVEDFCNLDFERRIKDCIEPQPDPLGWALNSGDGVYRP